MADEKPPSRGLCLHLAQIYWEMRPLTPERRELSWLYLMCWAAYDDWIELYWSTK